MINSDHILRERQREERSKWAEQESVRESSREKNDARKFEQRGAFQACKQCRVCDSTMSFPPLSSSLSQARHTGLSHPKTSGTLEHRLEKADVGFSAIAPRQSSWGYLRSSSNQAAVSKRASERHAGPTGQNDDVVYVVGSWMRLVAAARDRKSRCEWWISENRDPKLSPETKNAPGLSSFNGCSD